MYTSVPSEIRKAVLITLVTSFVFDDVFNVKKPQAFFYIFLGKTVRCGTYTTGSLREVSNGVYGNFLYSGLILLLSLLLLPLLPFSSFHSFLCSLLPPVTAARPLFAGCGQTSSGAVGNPPTSAVVEHRCVRVLSVT